MDTFASTSTVNELSLKPGNKVLKVENDLYLSNISKDQKKQFKATVTHNHKIIKTEAASTTIETEHKIN